MPLKTGHLFHGDAVFVFKNNAIFNIFLNRCPVNDLPKKSPKKGKAAINSRLERTLITLGATTILTVRSTHTPNDRWVLHLRAVHRTLLPKLRHRIIPIFDVDPVRGRYETTNLSIIDVPFRLGHDLRPVF
jgi:hypothetical protein